MVFVSKQSLLEQIVLHFDVVRQNYCPKTTLGIFICPHRRTQNRILIMPKVSVSSAEKITLLVEMLNIISRQDNLVHSWIKTLLLVQTGCSIAIAIIWREAQSLVPFACLLVSLVAMVATVLCTSAAVSDLRWQGRYCAYASRLDPTRTIYSHLSGTDISSPPSGDGRQTKALKRMAAVLIVCWLAIAVFAVHLRMSCYNQNAQPGAQPRSLCSLDAAR